jgi:hypothetical protein
MALSMMHLHKTIQLINLALHLTMYLKQNQFYLFHKVHNKSFRQ